MQTIYILSNLYVNGALCCWDEWPFAITMYFYVLIY